MKSKWKQKTTNYQSPLKKKTKETRKKHTLSFISRSIRRYCPLIWPLLLSCSKTRNYQTSRIGVRKKSKEKVPSILLFHNVCLSPFVHLFRRPTDLRRHKLPRIHEEINRFHTLFDPLNSCGSTIQRHRSMSTATVRPARGSA